MINNSINKDNIRYEMFKKIISIIDHAGLLYAVLYPGNNDPNSINSDIDIALGEHPKHVVEAAMFELEKKGEIRILQRLHYEVPYGYYYILTGPKYLFDTVLHLDCVYDPYGINSYAIPTTELIRGRIREQWGYRVSDKNMALYLLIKRAVKGKIDKTGLEILQRYFLPKKWVVDEKEIQKWFGKGAIPIVDSLSSVHDPSDAATILRQLKGIFLKTNRRSRPFQNLLALTWTAVRLTRRLLKPTGTFVVFLGPDGTGKSTISRAVEERLARVYRQVWHFHWRPGLIPKLGKKRESSIELEVGAHPPRESKYGPIVSALRYLYYLVDFTLGYWLVVYWKKAQTTLVIGERWYHDVIANPARYGFCLPRWILKLGGYLVPKPDHIFQITADPALIHQRKDELTVEEIAEQIVLYRGLLPDEPRGIEIVNQGNLDDSVKLICDSILNLLVDKTAKKISIDGK